MVRLVPAEVMKAMVMKVMALYAIWMIPAISGVRNRVVGLMTVAIAATEKIQIPQAGRRRSLMTAMKRTLKVS